MMANIPKKVPCATVSPMDVDSLEWSVFLYKAVDFPDPERPALNANPPTINTSKSRSMNEYFMGSIPSNRKIPEVIYEPHFTPQVPSPLQQALRRLLRRWRILL
jgi:hypothetical protein